MGDTETKLDPPVVEAGATKTPSPSPSSTRDDANARGTSSRRRRRRRRRRDASNRKRSQLSLMVQAVLGMDLMLAGLLGMTYTVVAMVLMIIGLSNGEPRDVAYEITIAALSGFIGSIVLWGGYRTFARTGPLYLRRESLKDYRCPRCDYDIRHLPGNRCPECGETWGYFELPPK